MYRKKLGEKLVMKHVDLTKKTWIFHVEHVGFWKQDMGKNHVFCEQIKIDLEIIWKHGM